MTHAFSKLLLLLGSGAVLVAACTGGNPGRDPCEGRECGAAEGKECGACPGATEACSDAGLCEDRCAGRECGEPVAGISCGQCTAPELCGLPGRCFVPGTCPADMIEVSLTGVCIDPYEVT
jgi:hypothetical protein